MGGGVAWRCRKCSAKHGFAIGIAAELTVEVGQIDCRRRILRTEPQRALVLGLGISGLFAPGKKVCKCGAGFRPFGIGALRSR